MYFEVHGLKEASGEKQNLQILVDSKTPGIIRDFFMKKNIIILSINPYKEDIEKYGKIYGKLADETQNFDFVMDEENIEDACYFLIYLGFNITVINDKQKPQNVENIENLIKKIRKQINEEQAQEETEELIKETEAKEVFEDKNLQRLQKIVEDVFAYITNLLGKVENSVNRENVAKLKKLEEHLRKLKMGRNAKTITDALEEVFGVMDKIKKEYMDQIRPEGKSIFENSVVTNIEVIDEYNKYKQSRLVKSLKIKQNSDDKYYIFTEKWGMFIRFLKKDILFQVKKIKNWLFKSFDIVEFILLVIIFEIAVFIFSDKLFFLANDLEFVYGVMIQLGFFGLYLRMVKRFAKKKIVRNIFLYALTVIAFLLSFYLVKMFFAL